MASRMDVAGDEALVECEKSGRYQIGRGIYRYKAGDKIPKGAKLLPEGEAPKVSSALRKVGANKRTGKISGAKGATGGAEPPAS